MAEKFPCISLPPLPIKHAVVVTGKNVEGTNKKTNKKKTPPTGLEPATPGLGGRCHIH